MNELEIVKLKDIRVSYGDVPVLEEVNLTILPHDFLGIIGPTVAVKAHY